MKLPALAIAAAFAGGCALGLCPPFAGHASSTYLLAGGLVCCALLIVFGVLLLRTAHLGWAAGAALLTWLAIGVMAAGVSEQPRPADHVLSMIQNGRISLQTPLTWHARLRDEPSRLPWGWGYELELLRVDYRDAELPLRGGMRLSFSPRPGDAPLPELHVGDEIAVVAQARRPQVFRDEGAFDRRAYLAQQGIDLLAALRAPDLLQRVAVARPSVGGLCARARRRLRDEVDSLFAGEPQVDGVLRAMLLGDRSFVDREESADFQKTGVFHVLVVAGLHVGALTVFLFWAGRKMRLTAGWTVLLTLTLLFGYVAVVEQRVPVLRAALMVGIVVAGRFFYRRLAILNSAGIAALLLLIADPMAIRDSGFQLTFLAIGCIGGLGSPWLARTVEPYARALRGWRDVTRDAAFERRQAQFRLDVRAAASWMSQGRPQRLSKMCADTMVGCVGLTFRVCELFVLTIALQIGMLPLMARDFHRVALSAPLVNLAAVPLTGVIVPAGFVALGCGLVVPIAAKLLAPPLGWVTLLLVHVVQWFAQLPRWSYRIPEPRAWVVCLFFLFALGLCVAMRLARTWERRATTVLWSGLMASSLLIVISPFSTRHVVGKLELTILDVGQGDSLVVVFPHGRTLLIDGGGEVAGYPGHEARGGIDPGEEAVSAYLWSRGYKKVDVVALTHAHQDHLGGLTAILQNFRVGELWIGREVNSAALARLENLARGKGISVEHERRGMTFDWDGVAGSVFWPEAPQDDVAATPANNDSLVVRLRYGGRTLLLPGDAEKQVERAILAVDGESAVAADVLKVGHHGSKNSTMPEFLAAVKPRIAVISAGEDNPYGHPSPELIHRLESAGVEVLRTDRDGAVHILTDGKSLEVTCFVACLQPGAADPSLRAQVPDQQK